MTRASPARDMPLMTLGHSNRSIDDFLGVLQDSHIERVVDVRTFPRSRTHPHFNIETLPASLAAVGVAYDYLPDLGGRRRKSKEIDPAVNAFWRVSGFHNYADHAMSDAFQASLRKLLALADERRTAMMCSEVLWWRCHRRIITDYAIASGRDVVHVFDVGHSELGRMTPAAIVRTDGLLAYPATDT
ncbi:Protein of unknown function, DUF488 [Luteibacter sp. UNCMF366Tsu5.1]|nr:Protein of unknown function, DUF488 [Luteibacter sp. UNCMF366Tsu5.1]